MISNENIIIINVENSEIIQQYAIKEIMKILDKYKNRRIKKCRKAN